jgi:hypothetical protein
MPVVGVFTPSGVRVCAEACVAGWMNGESAQRIWENARRAGLVGEAGSKTPPASSKLTSDQEAMLDAMRRIWTISPPVLWWWP